MDFDTWLAKAWDDHASAAPAVAARIAEEGPGRAGSAAELGALARLAQHVLGEHLQRWQEGRALLARLAAHRDAAAAAATLGVFDAALALAGRIEDLRPGLGLPERIRVTALAAGSLAAHDAEQTAAWLQEAASDAEAAGLDDRDPACRTLAAIGNNVACAMEEKEKRSAAERELMILGARTALSFWARAGTWLELERAQYRLAHTWIKAGDPAQARRHAQSCLDTVRQHDAPALEQFFAWEALACVERAAGDPLAQARAVQQARAVFERLTPEDRASCQASLDPLIV